MQYARTAPPPPSPLSSVFMNQTTVPTTSRFRHGFAVVRKQVGFVSVASMKCPMCTITKLECISHKSKSPLLFRLFWHFCLTLHGFVAGQQPAAALAVHCGQPVATVADPRRRTALVFLSPSRCGHSGRDRCVQGRVGCVGVWGVPAVAPETGSCRALATPKLARCPGLPLPLPHHHPSLY